jgi:hypothetical protein
VYAHEVYVLNGAAANTSYDVVLTIWDANTTCSGKTIIHMTTATLDTNAAGNGRAGAFFSPEQADGLRGLTVSAMWRIVESDGITVYVTDCEIVILD